MPVDSEFSSPESQVKVRVRTRSNRGNQLFNNNNDASTTNDNNDDNNDSTSFAGLGEEELSLSTQVNNESNSDGYDAGLGKFIYTTIKIWELMSYVLKLCCNVK